MNLHGVMHDAEIQVEVGAMPTDADTPDAIESIANELAPGRDEYVWETTMLAERTGNIHVHEGVSEDDFVEMRTWRDATLALPLSS